MTDALSAAIESILRTDDLSEEIHQAQINTLRGAYDAAKKDPPRREWRSFSEGALMGIYMDFDRWADKQWSNATFILRLMDTVQVKLKEKNHD
jgi:hypothetical protein